MTTKSFMIPAYPDGEENGMPLHDHYVGQAIAGLCAALSAEDIADLSEDKGMKRVNIVRIARDIATTALSQRSREIKATRGRA